MGLAIAVLSIFLVALAAPWIVARLHAAAGWVLGLLPLAIVAYLVAQAPVVAGGGHVVFSWAWAPMLGLEFALRLDGLSLLMSLLITGIGAAVVIYSGGYMGHAPEAGRFFGLLLLFMGAMLGLVLADNLILLYVFWELTTVSSWLLIGFDHQKAESRTAAWQSLLVTASGGLALLAGLVLLRLITGTAGLPEVLASGDAIRESPLYGLVLVLILAGAFTKSAQVPFHMWLPNAMAAPTPVSAYLHSATMVKAGVFLLARFSPALGGTDAWVYALTIVGTATMLLGAWLAVLQTDMKRVLAYTTISALGMLVMMLGVGGKYGATAAAAFLVAHALYKGALFLVVGSVDHEAGSRDLTELRGLGRTMPLTAGAAFLALASLAGIAPTFGYIAHELLLEVSQDGPWGGYLFAAAATIASLLYVAAGAAVVIRPFMGRRMLAPTAPHESPPSMWIGPVLLGVTALLLGVLPGWTARYLIAQAGVAIYGRPAEIYLSLWHGVNVAFVLGLVSVALGVVVFLYLDRLNRWVAPLRGIRDFGPDRIYHALIAAMRATAAAQSRAIQHGYLPHYLLVVLLALLGATGYAAWRQHGIWPALRLDNIRLVDIGLALLALGGAAGAVLFGRRIAVIASLGIVGFAVALFFAVLNAPDLAITQFLVETLFVVLIILVLPGLPGFDRLSSRRACLRDMLAAGAVGVTVAVLAYWAAPPETIRALPEYFALRSYVDAYGRNIVNVILVDFRALDTLGEITVLGVAAIGVWALLKLREGESKDP